LPSVALAALLTACTNLGGLSAGGSEAGADATSESGFDAAESDASNDAAADALSDAGGDDASDAADACTTLCGTLIASAKGPTCIAVDVSNVYWGGAAGMYVLPKAGGTPASFLNSSGIVADCAVSNSTVYGAYATKVLSWPITGTSDTLVIYDQNTIQGVAVGSNPTAAYWTDLGTDIIGVCPSSTCGTKATVLAASQKSPYRITADATDVYWTNQGDGTVMRAPRNAEAGAPVTIASGQATPGPIAVDATDVCWTTQGGNVMQWNIATSMLTAVATGQAEPEGIALDGTNVYWVNANGGQVLKAAKGGGASPILLATGQTKPWSVAVDGTYVYWTNNVAAGAVLRAPK
jgi:hypothetical protein